MIGWLFILFFFFIFDHSVPYFCLDLTECAPMSRVSYNRRWEKFRMAKIVKYFEDFGIVVLAELKKRRLVLKTDHDVSVKPLLFYVQSCSFAFFFAQFPSLFSVH